MDFVTKEIVIALGLAFLAAAVVVRIVKRGALIPKPAANYVQAFAFGALAVAGFLILKGIFVH